MKSLHIGHENAIIITKSVGLSGAHILTKEYYERLHERYACDFLAPILDYPAQYDYVREYAVLAHQEWSAVVESGYGGIYAALFHLGYASELGFRVDLPKIPIEQPVVEVAEFFDMNPYLLHSEGSLVIACPNAEKMLAALHSGGVDASVVGYMTKEKARIVTLGDEERFLTPVSRDELVKVLGERELKQRFSKNLVSKCREMQ